MADPNPIPPADPKPAAKAAAPSYVVARGSLLVRDPADKKRKIKLHPGSPFTPSGAEEAAKLLAAGTIVAAADYVAKAGGEGAAAQIAAANARADAAEAELAKLKAPPAK